MKTFYYKLIIVGTLMVAMSVFELWMKGSIYVSCIARAEALTHQVSKIEDIPSPFEIQQPLEAINIARHYTKLAILNNEPLYGKNYSLASEYYKRAENIITAGTRKLLLRYNWFKYQHSNIMRQERKEFYDFLKANRGDPSVNYMLAMIKWKSYYQMLSDREASKPHTIEILPDGHRARVEPIYIKYSPSDDNTLLNEAIVLLEMAVREDPTFANAYALLGRIYGFMGKLESSINNYILFYQNLDNLDMEFLPYNRPEKRGIFQFAEWALESHSPELAEDFRNKAQEILGLNNE